MMRHFFITYIMNVNIESDVLVTIKYIVYWQLDEAHFQFMFIIFFFCYIFGFRFSPDNYNTKPRGLCALGFYFYFSSFGCT